MQPFRDSPKAQQLRRKMIERQLKGRGIQNPAVIQAMEKVPRHLFCDFPALADAYADNPFPIECEQTISQPYMVALMTQTLAIHPDSRILEIGTGSGYQTAILCELSRQPIYSIERHPELAEKAKTLLTRLGYTQAFVSVGDGAKGLPGQAPFDRILSAAAATQCPQAMLEQLSPKGGILVIPIGAPHGRQELFKIIRRSLTDYETLNLGEVRFVPLITDSG